MSNSEKPSSQFTIAAFSSDAGIHLQWKPVPGAERYNIEYLCEDDGWRVLDILEDAAASANADGFVEFFDRYPGPVGPGGTYRVLAYASPDLDEAEIASTPVAIFPYKPTESDNQSLLARIDSLSTSAQVKALLRSIEWSPHGWKTHLPEDAGMFLGQHTSVLVHSVLLSDPVVHLLASILGTLRDISTQAEQAIGGHKGYTSLKGERPLTPAEIWIAEEVLAEKPGAWTMVVGIKGSAYFWHIEFLNTQFKKIWAGS
jgi:hypothetical protein